MPREQLFPLNRSPNQAMPAESKRPVTGGHPESLPFPRGYPQPKGWQRPPPTAPQRGPAASSEATAELRGWTGAPARRGAERTAATPRVPPGRNRRLLTRGETTPRAPSRSPGRRPARCRRAKRPEVRGGGTGGALARHPEGGAAPPHAPHHVPPVGAEPPDRAHLRRPRLCAVQVQRPPPPP